MKFKITVTTTKEFETTMDDYPPECKTEDDARVFEQLSAEDDPFLSAEGGDTSVIVERID